jgi:hypothetical protein
MCSDAHSHADSTTSIFSRDVKLAFVFNLTTSQPGFRSLPIADDSLEREIEALFEKPLGRISSCYHFDETSHAYDEPLQSNRNYAIYYEWVYNEDIEEGFHIAYLATSMNQRPRRYLLRRPCYGGTG